MNLLRCCAGCSAHLLVNDGTTQMIYCERCRPDHVIPDWADTVRPGSLVYLQPYEAWRGLSHSRYLVIERDGDRLTVQIVGVPASRLTTHIAHVAQHDVTPRATRGAAD